MKTIAAVALIAACAACHAGTNRFLFSFDPTKLKTEQRGTMTLFKYNDGSCRFVEQAAGAPVLPSVVYNVVMPKGAVYKSCRSSAQTQPLRGTYQVYSRPVKGAAAPTAQRYPARLVEFLGSKDVNGYRVFSFRAYPVLCQPADGSAAQILAASVEVVFDMQARNALYAPIPVEKEFAVRKLVVNPDDVTALTDRRVPLDQRRDDAAMTGRNVAPRDVFATPQDDSTGQLVAGTRKRKESADYADVFDFLKDNVYINDENDIVYAPIRF